MGTRFYSPHGRLVWNEPDCPFPAGVLAMVWEQCRLHALCAAMTDEIMEAIENDRCVNTKLRELIWEALDDT